MGLQKLNEKNQKTFSVTDPYFQTDGIVTPSSFKSKDNTKQQISYKGFTLIANQGYLIIDD